MKYSLSIFFIIPVSLKFSLSNLITRAFTLFKHRCFYIVDACKKNNRVVILSMRAAAAFAEWMKVHCLIKSYRENDEMIVLHCAETFAGACFSKQPIAYRSRISSKIINKQKGFFLPDPLSQDLKFPNFPAKKSLKKIIFTIVENQYRKNFFLLKN